MAERKIERKVIDGKQYMRYEGDAFWQEVKS